MAIVLPAASLKVELEDVSLDQLVFEYAWTILNDRLAAGRLRGLFEATLDANPGLAELGPILPLGQVVHVPEFTIENHRKVVRLWD